MRVDEGVVTQESVWPRGGVPGGGAIAAEVATTEAGAAVLDSRGDAPPLRRILIAVDTAAMVVAWMTAVLVFRSRVDTSAPSSLRLVGIVVVGVAAGLFLMSSAGLYRRTVCKVRSVELARIARVAGLLAVLGAFFSTGEGLATAVLSGTVLAAIAFALLAIERGLLREWIQGRRAQGHYRAPVLVVGGGTSLVTTARFLHEHPVFGFDVVGLSGPERPDEVAPFRWIGPDGGVVAAVESSGATGVVVDAGSLSGDELNAVVRALRASEVHVHVASALRGISSRRITVSPVADETFLHIAPTALTASQRTAKRVVDVVVATVLLVCSSPVLLLAILATKLQDGGPAVFKQTRVGHHGEHFTLYKFRTMVVGAELMLADVADRNGREGPLLKVLGDPRTTSVGRLLRATSIDELPQLLNVLAGSMSMVGPRPALPHEVARFDDELHARLQVKPGITGLWQVEARDLSSFDLYRRYDLLYVENWSVGLDLAIIARTTTAIALRAVRALWSVATDPARPVVPD